MGGVQSISRRSRLSRDVSIPKLCRAERLMSEYDSNSEKEIN